MSATEDPADSSVQPSDDPASSLAVRLFVNSLVGGIAWSAVLTAMAMTDGGFSVLMVLAYSAGGFTAGVVAGAIGSLFRWYLGRSSALDLPVGGAVVGGIVMAVVGAVLGYSFAFEGGHGPGGYVFRLGQAAFLMLFFGLFGAGAGAAIGYLLSVPAQAVLSAFDLLRAQRRD